MIDQNILSKLIITLLLINKLVFELMTERVVKEVGLNRTVAILYEEGV